MQDETKTRHAIALDEMEKLLADLTAEAMQSARRITEINQQVEAVTGTVEQQVDRLQRLRQKCKETRS